MDRGCAGERKDRGLGERWRERESVNLRGNGQEAKTKKGGLEEG